MEIVSYARFAIDYAVAVGAYLWASGTGRPMATLTALEPTSKVSTLVTRILGQNPGPFTLQGTNTYLVGAGKEKILIDAGEPGIEKYTNLLKETLEDSVIVAIVITHWHHDHTGGIADVFKKAVPVFKLRRGEQSEGPEFHYVEDGHTVTVEGATLRFVQTPGHTGDHASLWLEEESSLFSGDCILGAGTSVFEDLFDYMQSLDKLKQLKPTVIYPGHGPVVTDPDTKIAEYISHRLKRENDIMAVLDNGQQMTSMDITNVVYQSAPAAVKLAALNNVKHHLSKLIKDGRVEKLGMELYRKFSS